MSENFEKRNIGKFEFHLVRQNRKAPSILRDAKDNIWVYVNETYSDSDVEIFVQRSSVQIAKLMEPKIKLSFDENEIVDREEFLFLGNSYQLLITDNVKNDFNFDGRNFNLNHNAITVGKNLIKDFYIREANERLCHKKTDYKKIVGKDAKDIFVCELQDKWGVCTPSGVIKINWKAIMLPEKLFNYILAHEYTHLVHLNHSASFWHCLETLIEDSKHLDRELEKYFMD
nr:M48 family metallopeptidase [Bacteriovorax sp. HI3]